MSLTSYQQSIMAAPAIEEITAISGFLPRGPTAVLPPAAKCFQDISSSWPVTGWAKRQYCRAQLSCDHSCENQGVGILGAFNLKIFQLSLNAQELIVAQVALHT